MDFLLKCVAIYFAFHLLILFQLLCMNKCEHKKRIKCIKRVAWLMKFWSYNRNTALSTLWDLSSWIVLWLNLATGISNWKWFFFYFLQKPMTSLLRADFHVCCVCVTFDCINTTKPCMFIHFIKLISYTMTIGNWLDNSSRQSDICVCVCLCSCSYTLNVYVWNEYIVGIFVNGMLRSCICKRTV